MRVVLEHVAVREGEEIVLAEGNGDHIVSVVHDPKFQIFHAIVVRGTRR